MRTPPGSTRLNLSASCLPAAGEYLPLKSYRRRRKEAEEERLKEERRHEARVSASSASSKGLMHVCYATRTGHSQQKAQLFGEDAKSRGYAVALHDLSDWDATGEWGPPAGGSGGVVVFFVATWDGGRECADARPFFEWLRGEGDARGWAGGMRVSICGLGSSDYKGTYQAAAHDLRTLLVKLGADEAGPLGEEDERAPGEGYAKWTSSLWASLRTGDDKGARVEFVRVLWEGGKGARDAACTIASSIRDDPQAGCTASAGDSAK